MFNYFLVHIIRLLLALRYRVRVRGLEELTAMKCRSILFLPNHPALIDPFILLAHLYLPFRPRALADADQINRFFIRWLARRVQVLPIPAVTKDKPQTISQIRRVMEQCAAILRQGDNLLLYPAGGICRQSQEKIGNHSAVHTILQQAPQVRVVLVRTSGLWGSGFSWASGQAPVVGPALRQGIKSLLLNGIFFTPRRPVDIELVEPADFPRSADRPTINRYLEKFYNLPIQPSTCVPYTIWQKNSNQV